MTLPELPRGMPVDPYRAADLSDAGCDPHAKPGTIVFKDLVMQEGGHAWGIERACSAGHSDHERGRALDWMINADDPRDAADAARVIDWLLATDPDGNEHANARRAGIMYIIWNRRIWSARTRIWEDYPQTPRANASPHTDHVHFSLSPEGAAGETTLYRWLRGEVTPGGCEAPPVEPEPWWSTAGTIAGGALLGYFLTRPALWRRLRSCTRASKSPARSSRERSSRAASPLAGSRRTA